jgi:hypothetical protein
MSLELSELFTPTLIHSDNFPILRASHDIYRPTSTTTNTEVRMIQSVLGILGELNDCLDKVAPTPLGKLAVLEPEPSALALKLRRLQSSVARLRARGWDRATLTGAWLAWAAAAAPPSRRRHGGGRGGRGVLLLGWGHASTSGRAWAAWRELWSLRRGCRLLQSNRARSARRRGLSLLAAASSSSWVGPLRRGKQLLFLRAARALGRRRASALAAAWREWAAVALRARVAAELRGHGGRRLASECWARWRAAAEPRAPARGPAAGGLESATALVTRCRARDGARRALLCWRSAARAAALEGALREATGRLSSARCAGRSRAHSFAPAARWVGRTGAVSSQSAVGSASVQTLLGTPQSNLTQCRLCKSAKRLPPSARGVGGTRRIDGAAAASSAIRPWCREEGGQFPPAAGLDEGLDLRMRRASAPLPPGFVGGAGFSGLRAR